MFKWLYGSNLISKVDRLGTYAAALAYCFVLSMVPFLALTFALGMRISSHLHQGRLYSAQYAEVLHDIIPTGSIEPIFEAIQRSTEGGFLTIGFLVAAYTSFNLMQQIIRTLHFIFDDNRQGLTWTVAFKTLALLGIWTMLLLLISIFAVEASVVHDFLEHFLFPSLTEALVRVIQVLVVIAALFGTFFLTFYLVPARRYKTNLLVEGSLLAACGWIACSLLFAYVLPKILQTSPAYVALGSVVAILLWAQACAWSIIVGACWIVRFSRAK